MVKDAEVGLCLTFRFMRVDEQLKEQLLENTKETHWVPSHVKVSGRRINTL